MAAAPDYLSLQQFEQLYSGEKPYFEYWFGEAIQKSMPNSLHGLVQLVLGMLLLQRGWKAGSEVRLKISNLAHPVPDLVADPTALPFPYPDKPLALCVEILSPNDTLRNVFAKGAHYLDWGISSVWIIDPERRKAYTMSLQDTRPIELLPTDNLTAGIGIDVLSISLAEFFVELDNHLSKK